MSAQALDNFFAVASAARTDAKMLLRANLPVSALFVIFNTIGLHCTFCGERNNILTFDSKPLSFALRFVEDKDTCSVRMMKDRENASEDRALDSEADLRRFCAATLDFLNEKILEERSGKLRLVSQPDTELLTVLRSNAGEMKNQRFAEARRMINRGHLLDAVVELFTPFGLQPDLDEATVRFNEKFLRTNSEYAGVRICRFRKYGEKPLAPAAVPSFDAEDNMPLNLGACITIQFVRAHSWAQKSADKQRQVGFMLKKGGYVDDTEDDEYPQKVMMYDLSKWEDVLAMVERVLFMRDTEKAFKSPFEMSKWLGKQTNHFRGVEDMPDPWGRPRAHAYWLRKKGDKEAEVEYDKRLGLIENNSLLVFAAKGWKQERDKEGREDKSPGAVDKCMVQLEDRF